MPGHSRTRPAPRWWASSSICASTTTSGRPKIAMYLQRYHEMEIGPPGVCRILKRLELNRLPASQRYQRHDRRWSRDERPLPGHRVQLEVRFIAPAARHPKANKHYQYTAIDDGTRLRVLRIYPQQQPADRHPVPRLPAASSCRSESRSSRPTTAPSSKAPAALAPPGQRHQPRLHQAPHPAAQRQGGAFAPHRRRGVLPNARRRRDRRRRVFNDKLGRSTEPQSAAAFFYNYHRPTAASAARRPMRDASSEPRPGCNPSPSLAQAK